MDVLKPAITWVTNTPTTKAMTLLGVIGSAWYLTLVRYYRYKYLHELRRKYPDPDVVLEDSAIAEEIFSYSSKREFPFMYRQASEIALFKTYSVPTISRLLLSTGEFAKSTSRRAEDTELILLEITEVHARIENETDRNPNTSKAEIFRQRSRAIESVTRLNKLHGRYNILNDDFVYTLGLFILEPIRWINKYEFRKLDQREINAYFRVWYDVGQSMKIKDIPETIEKLQEFMDSHEKTKVAYHPANWKVADPTIRHVLTRLPNFMGPVARKMISCSLEPHIADAFKLEHPTWFLKKMFDGALYLRGFIIRHLFFPRRHHLIRTPFYPNKNGKYVPLFCFYKPEYPDGYDISALGPGKVCPVKHP